jgi:hypothetical protein
MDERREEALDCIRSRVWSGHYDGEAVFDIVEEDIFGSDGEDEAWLQRAVAREFRKKREAERGWPTVTTCDRLDRVFESLRGRGIPHPPPRRPDHPGRAGCHRQPVRGRGG